MIHVMKVQGNVFMWRQTVPMREATPSYVIPPIATVLVPTLLIDAKNKWSLVSERETAPYQSVGRMKEDV
jgi:hypothetical protein